MNMIKLLITPYLTWLFILCSILLIAVACDKTKEDILFTGDEYENIYQYIDKNPDSYSSFKKIIDVGQLTDALSSYNSHLGGENYTLFLPDNEAVERFIQNNAQYNSLDEILEDTIFTRELARYHLLNVEVISSDFANGALPDKTLSDDYLTITFVEEGGEILYSVNSESYIKQFNIVKSNGTIHVIDKMLLPVVYTGYEWVQNMKGNGYRIFSELLEITSLQDTMNSFRVDELGKKIYNEYTLFVESDELYRKNGILSLDDLIARIGPQDSDYSSPGNEVNKFARYHILTESVFLDDFKTAIYNTYGDLPVSVEYEGIDVKINVGSQIYDTLIIDSDTIEVNFLTLDIDNSNRLTKTGAIHQLDQVLYPYLPGRQEIIYEFFEEFAIGALRQTEGTTLIREEDLDVIDLFGVDFLTYTRSGTTIVGVRNRDYITVRGNFVFTYQTPKILAGTYQMSIVANRVNRSNAILEVNLDGHRIGNIVDLTSGTNNAGGFLPEFVLGTITFKEYSSHEIKLRSLVPGNMMLDRIVFKPLDD